MARRGVPGDIVRIDFDRGRHTHGQLLTAPYVAVHDLPTADEAVDPASTVDRPVLFVLAVSDRAIGPGRWPVVGRVPAGTPTVAVPDYFMQDIIDASNCQIIDVDGNSRPATPQECEGLERAAVWDAEHVEERIRDHYAGRPNAHLRYMQLRR